MIRMMFAAAILLLAGCAPPVLPPSTLQPDSPVRTDWQAAQTAEQCAAINGTWRPICLMGKPACVVTYKDAGKSCADSSECSGRCIADGAKPGAETRGQCTATSDPCGCFQLVVNGKADYMLCAD